TDGQLRWRSDTGGEFSASPIADERSVYLATEYRDGKGEQAPLRGALRAISKDTGVTRWMRTLSAPIRASMVANGLRLFAGGRDVRLYACDEGGGLGICFNQYAAPFPATLYV